MREDGEDTNPFTAEAEERLQQLMMRQKFEFDQSHAALLEHLGTITTEAARQHGLSGEPMDVLSATHNYIRDHYGHLGTRSLCALLAAFALAMADELTHCGAHGAHRPNERNNP